MKQVNEPLKSCENCGATISRRRYGSRLEDLTAFRKRRFCSLSCANTRKTLTKHGYSWRARKHLKTACEACNETRSLIAHHIDQDKTNNDPSNLQVMSPMAHSQKTNADKERARARLLAELAAYQEKYGPLESE